MDRLGYGGYEIKLDATTFMHVTPEVLKSSLTASLGLLVQSWIMPRKENNGETGVFRASYLYRKMEGGEGYITTHGVVASVVRLLA